MVLWEALRGGKEDFWRRAAIVCGGKILGKQSAANTEIEVAGRLEDKDESKQTLKYR